MEGKENGMYLFVGEVGKLGSWRGDSAVLLCFALVWSGLNGYAHARRTSRTSCRCPRQLAVAYIELFSFMFILVLGV